MTDDTEVQRRVVRLADAIAAILAGNNTAEAETALTLAVVAAICAFTPDSAAARRQAAEGFTRQARELIQREDIVEWIKASITWPSHGTARSQ